MTEEMIAKLEKAGAKRWQKGNMDRLYINAGSIGYTWDRYNTGNISHGYFNGEQISNCEMKRVLAAKAYVDCATGKINVNYHDTYYVEAVNNFVNNALN